MHLAKKIMAGAAGSGAAIVLPLLALAQTTTGGTSGTSSGGVLGTTTPGVPSTGAGDITTWVILAVAALAVVIGVMYFAQGSSSSSRGDRS